MIRSMTAFSQVKASKRQGSWSVEIRSLNHRYFEFSVRVPPALASLESRIRDLVQPRLRRGKITVAVSQDTDHEALADLKVDEDAVRFYLAAAGKLKKRFKLTGDLHVRDLLKLPGLFSAQTAVEHCEKIWLDLKGVLNQALAKTVRAKEIEGKKLARDVRGRLRRIEEAVNKIENLSGGESRRLFEKLSERVRRLLQDAAAATDPDRILREAAILAQRCDITEEIVRMKSHLDLFGKRLMGREEMGRELDFLCQEMHREVNTMGSKTELFEVSKQVVFVKGELEKVREQVQNIE